MVANWLGEKEKQIIRRGKRCRRERKEWNEFERERNIGGN